jgi:uncharacterized protein YlzI (FlbEa/FlbD family)
MKQKPLTRIKRVMLFNEKRGINKESVNNVYFKILQCKKHSS